jgi:hypothetical protein
MPFCGMWRPIIPVRTDVSEERMASFLRSVLQMLVIANVPSPSILVNLMMEAIRSSETSVLTEPHVVSSQNTAFFIVTAVKTSNLT